MESSEDDAGAATNASRRASAREKDDGRSADGDPSGDPALDAAGSSAASESASMSEEAFDADSVPSPSAQDVNTSTEAILDMIDEIVDGPDAPKRRSRASEEADPADVPAPPAAAPSVDQQPPSECEPPQPSPTQPSTSVASAKSEIVSLESSSDIPVVCTSQNSTTTSDVYMSQEAVNDANAECISEIATENKEEVTQECLNNQQPESESINNVSEGELVSIQAPVENLSVECPPNIQDGEASIEASVSNQPSNEVLSENDSMISVSQESTTDTLTQSTSCEMTREAQSSQASSSVPANETAESTSEEAPSSIPLNIPSSSVIEPESENVLDSSENQASERTIKCVTSSDNRDSVTVESAESTSSDNSVSEARTTTSEAATRSPLRRRLVRPAPSDRRPDSTVSSTVDSQTVNVHTTEQSTSESVAKDVSSSSDAVPSVYGNVKPEEIRNLSEISVCKAETSMNPPKKIKLIRHKLTASAAQRDNTPETPAPTLERELCQSTSSDCTPSVLSETSCSYPTPKCEDVAPNVNDQCASNNSSVNIQENVNKDCADKQDNQNILPEIPKVTQSPTPIEVQKVSESEEPKRVPPIKLNLVATQETASPEKKSDIQEEESAGCSSADLQEASDSSKQVPKLTIKLGNKPEEPKSPIPKLTIKPIRPPQESESSKKDSTEQIPCITKLNIKPIRKPAEKVNDIHRKSSSSEISESESSENDESNSTSDQASNSDQFTTDIVPKVTIKVGKPGTESEGKFYTEQNAPKLLIKGLQSSENDDSESVSKLKLIISQPEDKLYEKVPKLTIKTVTKSEGQPLSPKLMIKPIKPPDNSRKDVSSENIEGHQIPKLKITTDSLSSSVEIKEYTHVPKITIKPVAQTATDTSLRTPKKSTVVCDSPEHIPVVTKINIKPIMKPVDSEESECLEERVPVVSKLNIKPIVKPTTESLEILETQVPIVSKLNIKPVLKPTETGEASEKNEDNVPVISKLNIKPIFKPPDSIDTSEGIQDKVPVVSKLNIKPIVKPKDNEVESSLEDIPKVTKLNIKPLRNPEAKSSDEKDCDELNADTEKNSIPVVTKINIKPIVKPVEEETSKDSENQSSETGNSSDDNGDHIPVVTKINIKPILKPCDSEESIKPNSSNEDFIPVVTKLNIKPLIKPEESKSPSSPKRDCLKITKLNIKPVLKPEEIEQQKSKCENQDAAVKNPPLVMKINFKSVTDATIKESLSHESDKKCNNIDDNSERLSNNVEENIPKVSKLNIKPIVKPVNTESVQEIVINTAQTLVNCKSISSPSLRSELPKQNCIPSSHDDSDKHDLKPLSATEEKSDTVRSKSPSLKSSLDRVLANSATGKHVINDSIKHGDVSSKTVEVVVNQATNKPHASLQNCTLLKKLLETKKDGLDKRLEDSRTNVNHSLSPRADFHETKEAINLKATERVSFEVTEKDHCLNKRNDLSSSESLTHVLEENIRNDTSDNTVSDNTSKPLQISISDKISNQSSGPDSPRIILKINKTDHGASAKIITEERPATPQQNDILEHGQDIVNEKQSQKKIMNSRKKLLPDTPVVNMGKRLRSSRIVENTEKSPPIKRNITKRPSSTETSPIQSKEPELSVLETKRLKLGQLLSNKSLTIKTIQVSPTKPNLDSKPTGKMINHSVLNNENCSKNGNSKLHNILSNLQAKQAQALALNDVNCSEKMSINTELDSNTSTGSSDVVEIVPLENSRPSVQEMILNENSESHDFQVISDEVSQDPLEVDIPKESEPVVVSPIVAQPIMTPQPKKRGRPRKLPVSEGAKPAPVVLPTPALEERPQRSLRLSRDQSRTPASIVKPRGRGRGRGVKRAEPAPPPEEPLVESATKFFVEERKPAEDIDPTSSRIKLPRMTEALDKMPTACATPLSSRRRISSTTESKLYEAEPKVVLDMLPKLEDVFLKSPEQTPGRGKGGRGSRGGRGRTPRGGRRGRGGGRGAMYMKETMGIYGRVCGPATTTVQLFEEETCMMDDNATPAKPSHLLDEDSQSSVMSSTNDSSKMRKSKFADLFDSNKVWTAADVKEYMWPPPEQPDVEHQVMMIQEQVAMFLNVKSFKRRYPELKRRTIGGEERDFVLNKGLVTEALCDLGITAVDASEVLDIMLSDYPHKYEEYRSHQRQRQLAAAEEVEAKPEARVDRVEMKADVKPPETKPEPPKVDLEKSRQEALAAAIASASEWNARVNQSRAGACVDLQSGTLLRRRPAARAPPRPHVRPPAGFYPHALLPGQYQHAYRLYTPDQLRYFPLNTVTGAPPPPPPAASDSDSSEWGSSSSSDDSMPDRPAAKRKKLTKTKRSSAAEAGASTSSEPREEVDLCRVCKLRLEANRKHTHERFLVCAQCNAKLHPGCVDLSADTIRKVREYAWQCAECKTCCTCQSPGLEGKMLFCDLCDRGFHIFCQGLDRVPSGRWHCVECAICKSCGAREPSGPAGAGTSASATPGASASATPGAGASADEARWHHQTRRGPGGHKVYSHSLCTPCARAYRIGRYCPLCERSFIGPKGTMQLVICKLCDRQHHQECVRQSVAALNVLDYTCGECRRGGITSRAAAVRLAPRTIATLFMAKRRFNKYAHRQYLQSRRNARAKEDSSNDVAEEEAGERAAAAEDASDADEPRDPLEGAGEAAAAVAQLAMDFGD